jgi:hypothetical protein
VDFVEDFAREVYGRIPNNVAKVMWRVVATDTGTIGGRRVIGKQLTGHVDNTAFPDITVDIPLTVVVPADAKGPAPMMILFRPPPVPSTRRSGAPRRSPRVPIPSFGRRRRATTHRRPNSSSSTAGVSHS